jgi:hypothetical protein
MSRFVIAFILLFALAAGSRAATITLYDGAAGTLPQAQPWLTYIGSVTPTVVPDGVALDTSSSPDLQAGFFNHKLVVPPKSWIAKNPAFPVLNPAEGFTLSFWLALPDEDHLNGNRAGFSAILIGDDRRGIELGFWKNRVWAQGGPAFTQAEGADFDATGRTLYALSIRGSSYTLRANGAVILTGLTRDYSAASPFVDPYEQPGMVFLGDDTTSASASFTLGSIWLEQPYVPVGDVDLAALTLGASVVAGCRSVSGKILLSAPAPTSGTVVTISDTLNSATSPVGVTVPGGATTRSFSIKTNPVAATESGSVIAKLGPTTLSQNLAVRPIGLAAVTLTPTSVVGGNSALGKALLECAAAPGAIEVVLSSSNSAAASPDAPSIFVPQGMQSATFDVTTNSVLARTTAVISGAAGGIQKSKLLTVTPAAVASPTSLKFLNVTVGQTSSALNVTLTNKGTVPFAIDTIGVTGTYAAWFAQTNDCPASLAPGGSCTTGVTFTPSAAASRSAKLQIYTSATSAPLSVSLSGTGI